MANQRIRGKLLTGMFSLALLASTATQSWAWQGRNGAGLIYTRNHQSQSHGDGEHQQPIYSRSKKDQRGTSHQAWHRRNAITGTRYTRQG